MGSAVPYSPLIRDAERLLQQHGDGADLAAARLADASFMAGDNSAGDRWARIFRILAASHVRRVGQGAGRMVTYH
jgi:hypothetical protein